MSEVKNFIKSSSIYAILGTLPIASRIVLMPFYLLYLPPSEFAKISLNTTMAGALGIFMSLGFDAAFTRYYFDYRKNAKILSSYFSTILISIIVIGIAIILIILPFGNSLHHLFFKNVTFTFFPYGITALFIAFTGAINGCILMFYRNEQKPYQYLYFAGGLFVFSSVAEFIAIIVFHLNADGIILFKLSSSSIYSLIFWFLTFKKIGFSFEPRFLKSSLSYSLPLIPYMFFGFIYTSYDRIMIENHLDLDSLAIYNLAFAVVSITEIIMVALQNAIFPRIYSFIKLGYEAHKEKINMQLKAFVIILIIAMVTLLSLAPWGIFNHLLPIYKLAVFIIPLLFIGISMRFLYVIYTIPLFYLKQTRKLPWLNILAGFATVIFNLMFLPTYGLYGAAISMIIARVSQILLAYYWYKKASAIRFDLGYIKYVLLLLLLYLTGLAFAGKMTHSYFTYVLYAMPLVIITLFFAFKFALVIRKNGENRNLKLSIINFLNGTSDNR